MKRRNFIRISALGTLITGSGLSASCMGKIADSNLEDITDIAVVGGTPAGIMAAIAAARMGSKVILTEYHSHLGGMTTSGLGKSDIENKEAIAGLFKEFTEKVLQYYIDKYGENSNNIKLCKEGYYYEPSVAELVFNQMIAAEKNIKLLFNYQLEEAELESGKITKLGFKDRKTGENKFLKAEAFVDATYEGDVFALAGAAYRLGREGKEEFNEAHAGHIFFDFNEKAFLEGGSGKEDSRLPAYTYRLCMTDDPENSYVLTDPPHGYDRSNYVAYFKDLEEGRLSAPKVFKEGHGYYADHFDTMVRVFSFTEIPNQKYDVNINPRPLGFPFVGENYVYPESDWAARERIFQRHRELTLGLIYFVQNDPEIPEEQRNLAKKYHLPKDEFTDNEHFPWQLYIREARRLKGKYTLTENDVTLNGDAQRTTVFEDTIITGEFPIDSFPVSKVPSKDNKVLEGYIGMYEISPYQIPYRILVPEKVLGLIVPVAASTTHVAYSTVRMEPLWMGIGQVAGIAAHLSRKLQVEIKDVPVLQLQDILIKNHQILTYFKDIDRADKAFDAVQFWGTKGFFNSYLARTKEKLSYQDYNLWLSILRNMPNMPKDLSAGKPSKSVETVSISTIKKLTQALNKSGDLNLNADSWLYNKREKESEVLRGEACLAMYQLYQNTSLT
ncbi:FAD-dependent oxidoreductase [Cyclobacterium marinum]|uniref:FAD-dependent oxidoreductase n=1 Tax=Cyclobacterium marinum TaxID=104 RepID=UPI0011F01AC4|nr:FAD-dependent oxidoreductase [Cyclobacterium marinum]MBI0397254.1 FAD-dependent oxidoreductase [Cyclobacterium marinum]